MDRNGQPAMGRYPASAWFRLKRLEPRCSQFSAYVVQVCMAIRPRLLLFTALILAAHHLPGAVAAAPADKPNVVVFLVDDLGWTDVAAFGGDFYETPNIDRLAADGLRFTAAYAAGTVCSPTRAALMTGMYPARTHVTDWIDGMWEHLSAAEKSQLPLMPPDWTKRLDHRYTTLAEALKADGYLTALIGKWHLTPRSDDPAVVEPYYPTHHGFDVNIAGNQWGEPGSYYAPYRLPAGTGLAAHVENFPVAVEGQSPYLTDMLTDQAVSLIERWQGQPFFLLLSHYAVHAPFEGRQDLVETYRRKDSAGLNHQDPVYAAMVESMDQSLGRVRDALTRTGIAGRTIILFTSDNGGLTYMPGPTTNAPLRGGKGSPYEGGVRVPAILVWPGVIAAGGITDQPVITLDWYPTILAMTGTKGDAEHNGNLDGVSLVPILRDPAQALDRQAIYWHYPHYHKGGSTPYTAVRAGPWRLIEFYEDQRIELYNLTDDRGEQRDLSGEFPEKGAELRALIATWRDAVGAQSPQANPEYQRRQ
jgi:arylsulfatase A